MPTVGCQKVDEQGYGRGASSSLNQNVSLCYEEGVVWKERLYDGGVKIPHGSSLS